MTFTFAFHNSIAQFKLYPIVHLITRKSYLNENDCRNAYNTTITYDANNNGNSDCNGKIDNHATLHTDDADEIDNVSLEILWEPPNGTQITADVVFIHGLHGKCEQTS